MHVGQPEGGVEERAGSEDGWVGASCSYRFAPVHAACEYVYVPRNDTYSSIPSTSRNNYIENGLPVYQHPHANIGLLHTVMMALICDLIAP